MLGNIVSGAFHARAAQAHEPPGSGRSSERRRGWDAAEFWTQQTAKLGSFLQKCWASTPFRTWGGVP